MIKIAQIKYFDKRVGITYVYESESYYDKEKHQSRSKRKLIGKIDPETGEIIPTGKRGRPLKDGSAAEKAAQDYQKLYEKALLDIEKKEKQISSLEHELQETRLAVQRQSELLRQISAICASHT